MKKSNVKKGKANRLQKAIAKLKKYVSAYMKEKEIQLCVSAGNSKIGRIKNISIAPILSCNGVCKFCMSHCYDIKAVLQYTNVAKARARNYVLLMHDPFSFYVQAFKAIKGTRKNLFRFNVGGELLNICYLQIIVKLASDFPEKKFLLFTKKHFLVNSYCEKNGGRNAIPENLKLIFSMWPGMEVNNPYNFPLSCPYPNEKPKEWKACIGNCETCADLKCGCWDMKAGDIVGFHYHGTEDKAFSESFKEWEKAV